MTSDAVLTRDQILGEVVDVLSRNDFSFVGDEQLVGFDSIYQRVFEDAYSVVAVVYFESWEDLKATWIEVQTSFVELISENFTRSDRKSWEAYLVLMSTDLVPSRDSTRAHDIRYNTSRVRKLLATGDQLRELRDVEACLLPLLPIRTQEGSIRSSNVLQQLPGLISGPELSRQQIQAIVDAYEQQASMLEAVYQLEDGP
ncbi:hypothetical protein ACYFX5_11735 [Bremerella sp. T1]|uniref:hypothetical protein n=1 Tax=Bremerella sp. TYQ1 TaxID=3119568 RepID=UPI001CCA92AD|nr:hypothetical protein [Bremerella volcania]UBM33743.1 hypothetical protein LA756_13680 [Bremerella volcania]